MVSNQQWLNINALAILGPENPLPKHLEKLLPKFDLDNDILPENHINKFMLAMNIMNVQHEDVACMLFYFTLWGKASSWLFSLPPRSITSWQLFETSFITQFGDDKTSRTLFDLSRLIINKKGKVKEFNQIFITLLNKICDKPPTVVQIEFYAYVLPPPISMFMKSKEIRTLKKNFVESINVQKDLASIYSHPRNEESESSPS